jgi:RNA polymerase sigma factor (sigma-70 family)
MRASVADPEIFAEIFERYAPAVHRYLASRVGKEAAEDLVSEVFATAFRSRANFDPHRGGTLPWLLGIATNLIRRFRRSEIRRWAVVRRFTQLSVHRSDQVLPDVAEDAETREELAATKHAIDALSENQREVLILYSGFGLSYEEIAQALGLRLGTVRSRLFRARDRVAELLASSGQYANENGNALSRQRRSQE